MNTWISSGVALVGLLASGLAQANAAAPTTSVAATPVEQPAPHPEPRVIVTVTALQGAHEADAVQRAARETWARLVRCYKQLAHGQRGHVTIRVDISAVGRVTRAQRLSSTLNEGVAACVADALSQKPMPIARGRSSATVEVRLAPGDEQIRQPRS